MYVYVYEQPPPSRSLHDYMLLSAVTHVRFIFTLSFSQRLGAYLSLSDEQDLPLKSRAIQVHEP